MWHQTAFSSKFVFWSWTHTSAASPALTSSWVSVAGLLESLTKQKIWMRKSFQRSKRLKINCESVCIKYTYYISFGVSYREVKRAEKISFDWYSRSDLRQKSYIMGHVCRDWRVQTHKLRNLKWVSTKVFLCGCGNSVFLNSAKAVTTTLFSANMKIARLCGFSQSLQHFPYVFPRDQIHYNGPDLPPEAPSPQWPPEPGRG